LSFIHFLATNITMNAIDVSTSTVAAAATAEPTELDRDEEGK
jgi:hypothetical protein